MKKEVRKILKELVKKEYGGDFEKFLSDCNMQFSKSMQVTTCLLSTDDGYLFAIDNAEIAQKVAEQKGYVSGTCEAVVYDDDDQGISVLELSESGNLHVLFPYGFNLETLEQLPFNVYGKGVSTSLDDILNAVKMLEEQFQTGYFNPER